MNRKNNACAVAVGKVYAVLSNSEYTRNDLNDAVSVGEYFSNLTIKDAVAEIVKPEDNQHGVVIRTCGVNASNKSAGVQLFADTLPPAVNIRHPLYVPPGHGVWFTVHDEGTIAMTYDFLEYAPS